MLVIMCTVLLIKSVAILTTSHSRGGASIGEPTWEIRVSLQWELYSMEEYLYWRLNYCTSCYEWFACCPKLSLVLEV